MTAPLSPSQFGRAAEAVAERAAGMVEPGMRLGLGTGRMATALIAALRPRVVSGLRVQALCTSLATERRAREAGIELLGDTRQPLDLDLDGADEFDAQLDLLKGGGGALLREKVVAERCRRFWALVDSTKGVSRLAARHPLAVEVLPFGWQGTSELCQERLGCRAELRGGEERPFVTDNGNYVLDLHFEGGLERPRETSSVLAGIAGVLGHGLFLGLATAALVAEGEEVRVLGDLGARRAV